MKKILISIVSILFVVLLGNSNVSAKEVLTEPEVYDFLEVQKYVVENFIDLIKLDEEGKLYITDTNALMLNENIKEQYFEGLKDINRGVELGVTDFNAEFMPVNSDRHLKMTDNSIEKGISRIDPDQPPTYALGSVAVNNKQIMKDTYSSYLTYLDGRSAYMQLGFFFANKVKTGGEWDLKKGLGLTKTYRAIVGSNTYLITGEDLGNIHYGYVGSYQFPAFILKTAAGFAQIIDGNYKIEWYSSYFDDPRDQAAIQRGIDWNSTGTLK